MLVTLSDEDLLHIAETQQEHASEAKTDAGASAYALHSISASLLVIARAFSSGGVDLPMGVDSIDPAGFVPAPPPTENGIGGE